MQIVFLLLQPLMRMKAHVQLSQKMYFSHSFPLLILGGVVFCRITIVFGSVAWSLVLIWSYKKQNLPCSLNSWTIEVLGKTQFCFCSNKKEKKTKNPNGNIKIPWKQHFAKISKCNPHQEMGLCFSNGLKMPFKINDKFQLQLNLPLRKLSGLL